MSELKKGTIVTLLASYCDENECDENNPCTECIKMSNQFVLDGDVKATFLKEVEALK